MTKTQNQALQAAASIMENATTKELKDLYSLQDNAFKKEYINIIADYAKIANEQWANSGKLAEVQEAQEVPKAPTGINKDTPLYNPVFDVNNTLFSLSDLIGALKDALENKGQIEAIKGNIKALIDSKQAAASIEVTEYHGPEIQAATELKQQQALYAAAKLWKNLSLHELNEIAKINDNNSFKAGYISAISETADRLANKRDQATPIKEEDINSYNKYYDPYSAFFNLQEFQDTLAGALSINQNINNLRANIFAYINIKMDTISKYKKTINKNADQLKEAAISIVQFASDKIADAAKSGIGQTLEKIMPEEAEAAIKNIGSFLKSAIYRLINENFIRLQRYEREHKEQLEEFINAEVPEAAKEMAICILIELEKEQNRGKFLNCTLADVAKEGFDEQGNITQSQFTDFLIRAAELQKTIEEMRKVLPTANARPIEKAALTIDKVSQSIWSLTDEKLQAIEKNMEGKGKKQEFINGQLEFTITAATDKDKKQGLTDEISIAVAMTPGNIAQEFKNISHYDKLILVFALSLIEAGNEIFSPTQIYKLMKGKGNPSNKDTEKIMKSIKKLQNNDLGIDNTNEANHYKYTKFIEKRPILPCVIKPASINNKLTEDAIHVTGYPIIAEFARQRGQLIYINHPDIFAIPGLAINDESAGIMLYLLERISRKNKKNKADEKSMSILLNTLYERCNIKITDSKKKSRTITKINKILKHWVNIGYIKEQNIEEKKGRITIIKK